MLREAFVHERVVGSQQIDDAAVLAKHALQKQGGFTFEGVPQTEVEVGKQSRARRLRVHITQVQPLRGKIGRKRLGAGIAKHPAHLLIQHGSIAQLAPHGKLEQLLVRNAAPQEE